MSVLHRWYASRIIVRAVASLGETWHRWDVIMDVRASMWASGCRHGRRGSLVWAGTTTCSPHLIMGRRQGRRDVGRAVGMLTGPPDAIRIGQIR